jgi:hypothetical protein
MRKIEQQMNNAIAQGESWTGSNTQVVTLVNGVSEVFLHGHHIAQCYGTETEVDIKTLLNWPTRTTMSRLRALGVDVCTRRGDIYLNGEKLA